MWQILSCATFFLFLTFTPSYFLKEEGDNTITPGTKPPTCSYRLKIPILPTWEVFCFATPLPPGNSSLASYFAANILTFKTPLPIGISDDLPWGGYGFFLEFSAQHIKDPQFTLKPCQGLEMAWEPWMHAKNVFQTHP